LPGVTPSVFTASRDSLKPAVAWLCMLALFAAGVASAQPRGWRHVPSITVIGSDANDVRFGLLDEAVTFWNRTFEELDSGFRLGSVTRMIAKVPDRAVQSLSDAALANPGVPMTVAPALADLPGDILVLLSDSDFVSFAALFADGSRRLVGIKGMTYMPFTLRNVARNVIAHELGHAIGLRHNSDSTKLMCGRPSPCRPDLFQSDSPRFFPLTDEEKRALGSLYPSGWKPRI